MIYEYALDPELLSNWTNFQRIISLFGITKGRLISRFPRRWERMVYDSCASGTTERSRIEIALKRISRDMLLPRKHYWGDGLRWIDNAKAEHTRRPFHAVLASEADPILSFVIDATDLDHTDLPKLLEAGPSKIILRTPEELGRAVLPLFLLSKQMLIVEPNFRINGSGFLKTWEALMKSMLDTQGNLRPSLEIELHLGADKLNDFVDAQASLNAKLAPLIPAGNRVSVVNWPKEDVHNRYLLTDKAGIQIGEGLGLPDERSNRRDDTLSFTDKETTDKLIEKYKRKRPGQATYLVDGTMRIPR